MNNGVFFIFQNSELIDMLHQSKTRNRYGGLQSDKTFHKNCEANLSGIFMANMMVTNFIFFLIHLSCGNAAFYASTNGGKLKYRNIIHKTDAPSLISCTLRCREIDLEADAIFEQDLCSCIKQSEEEDNEENNKEMTISGVFMKKVTKVSPRIRLLNDIFLFFLIFF